ncbi:chemotaxis-specific protein-glutamate methyltransferase CheB [Duganella qianjiadongensis]|uniref:Protein-glutamate methylesterase/protein-glutamine glutaminase n=1 Tax=Duganella qianjiadongensis TaxID=2692176 RepID=A0ABW9VHV3_9BURK|nr:chemotaxis-specific protein-glutamate methyltransferase CheB [Duganella qianjiadongensis]MYM39199.1 chemotaxis-specific protein-glutamate methyltransferase CheB [Duganella qianjiadongensis]
MLKLLIVDDSALMRRLLQQLFKASGEFRVEVARDGVEAVALNTSFEPDVVTLDINMPEMDGLTALALMMQQRPVPVVMLSSLTEQGALATFEALNLGALDYIAKPSGSISLSLDMVGAELLDKVRSAARSRLSRGWMRRQALAPVSARAGQVGSLTSAAKVSSVAGGVPAATATAGARTAGVVLIGVSTGGPRALEEVLPRLPASFPWPVVVAQHMPGSFTGPFAARLNGLCALNVCEAAQPMAVSAGNVYIARGGADVVLCRRNGVLTVMPKPEDRAQLWHPSVTLLARSALACVAPQQLVAVMLTGMGNDGAEAFAEIRRQGGRTLAEAEETAVVYGMPGELVARGGASMVLPLDGIAAQLKNWLRQETSWG